MYLCNQHMQTHTCAHINSEIHGNTHIWSWLHALDTQACTRRHTDRDAHTRACTHTHLTQTHKHTLRHGSQPHTNLHRHTSLHRHTRVSLLTRTHPRGHRPMPACTLQCSLQAPLPGRAPTPTHSSLRGPWPAGWTGARSGGWASGGGRMEMHQAGERRRPDDLGRLGGRALPCPGMRS